MRKRNALRSSLNCQIRPNLIAVLDLKDKLRVLNVDSLLPHMVRRPLARFHQIVALVNVLAVGVIGCLEPARGHIGLAGVVQTRSVDLGDIL